MLAGSFIGIGGTYVSGCGMHYNAGASRTAVQQDVISGARAIPNKKQPVI